MTGVDLPHLDVIVTCSGDQPLPIRSEKDACHPVGVFPENGEWLTGFRRPEPDGAIVASRGEPPTVRGERYIVDVAIVAAKDRKSRPDAASQSRMVPS